jgi:glycosyltransferase involved in cell wall biosynthesis
VKAALELVDVLIAPSQHLRRRFIEWGIPADKIRYEDYGRVRVEPIPDPPDAGRRRRIGFFGQMTETKGVDVLLEAMKILDRENTQVRLLLHGANLEHRPQEFQQRVRTLLDETKESVSFVGRYAHGELPALMSAVDWVIVPSIWWENSPLVIQEALMQRRPVICSDVGGMAEKIRDGVNGLHFHVRDPYSLANTIRRAVTDPELWHRLRGQLTDPHGMDAHLAALTGIYHELLAPQRTGLAAT